MKEKKRGRTRAVFWCVLLLLLCGLFFLLYPQAACMVSAQRQGKAVSGYLEEESRKGGDGQAALLEEARAYNRKLWQACAAETGPEDLQRYEKTLCCDRQGTMGVLEIPKIGVRLPILHGTGESVLAKAAGHVYGSSLPVGGRNTHAVLAAHSGLPGSRLFTDLSRLEEGDHFSIRSAGRTIWYRVTDCETVLPDETGSLKIRKGEDLCTLLTCTPVGINSHRLLVHGERSREPESIRIRKEKEQGQQASSVRILLPAAAAAAAGGALLLCAVHRRRR